MQRLYEPEAYDETADAGNFWRSTVEASAPCPRVEGRIHCDFAVIGAGFTGLNAALHLARGHSADVVVIDAEEPGWGASGRNGGFVCLGGAKASQKALARRHGQAEAQLFARAERAAVDHVADILQAEEIEADRHSEGETLVAHRPREWTAMVENAEQARTLYGVDSKLIPFEELTHHGMAAMGLHGAMTIPVGFAINPLKYLLGLAKAARDAGATLFGRSPVTSISLENGKHILTTPTGTVEARTLILATNGYSSEDVPGWMASRYLPVQSNILVTRPLTGEEVQAQGWTTSQMTYDTRKLLHYFRLMPDNRMLFGMRGGITADTRTLARRKSLMRRQFGEMFPAWSKVETPHFWSGLLCFARNLTPYVGPLGDLPRAFTAFAYHGNGVAMGSYAGALLSDLATGGPVTRPYPALMRAPAARFPLGRFRRALLAPAVGAYALMDMR